MLRFWIIAITKQIGRDEATTVHNLHVYTREQDAIADAITQATFAKSGELVEVIQCTSKKTVWKHQA